MSGDKKLSVKHDKEDLTIKSLEIRLIKLAFLSAKSDRNLMAKKLGIVRKTLDRKIEQYNLTTLFK